MRASHEYVFNTYTAAIVTIAPNTGSPQIFNRAQSFRKGHKKTPSFTERAKRFNFAQDKISSIRVTEIRLDQPIFL